MGVSYDSPTGPAAEIALARSQLWTSAQGLAGLAGHARSPMLLLGRGERGRDFDREVREMEETLISVAEYHLSGKDANIVFIDGDVETMRLEYNGQVFKSRQLHLDRTAFGRVITVVLEAIPDLHTIYLSMAIPAANRSPNVRSVPIESFAVITQERTSIAGPGIIEGQIQTYKTIALTGNAW
jgi:hypothetical protein